MGPALGDPHDEPLPDVTVRVLERAGFTVIFPENMGKLCCGMPFESKGFVHQADRKVVRIGASAFIGLSQWKISDSMRYQPLSVPDASGDEQVRAVRTGGIYP